MVHWWFYVLRVSSSGSTRGLGPQTTTGSSVSRPSQTSLSLSQSQDLGVQAAWEQHGVLYSMFLCDAILCTDMYIECHALRRVEYQYLYS